MIKPEEIFKKKTTWLIIALAALLFYKFFRPLFVFDVPLGYDPGMYRYLFVKHAQNGLPFDLSGLPAWVRQHPIGLFLFASPLINLGVPADWLTGWIWNLFTVLLAFIFARTLRIRFGPKTAAVTLLMVLLSQAYYDGFTAMYWKAYLALLWMVLAFGCLDKKSWWAALFVFLCLITHHQTGLLLALVLGSQWLYWSFTAWRTRTWQTVTLAGALCLAATVIFYLPIWQNAIVRVLGYLFTQAGNSAYGGSFPDLSFFIKTNPVLLGLGLGGLVLYIIKNEKTINAWLLSVFWSGAFVFLRLYFYKRFFLYLDFFLLPFAAYMSVYLWDKKAVIWKISLTVFIIIQLVLTHQATLKRVPIIPGQELKTIKTFSEALPENAYLLTIENNSPFWVQGWNPDMQVGGPGLLDMPWTYQQWEQFIYGNHEQRAILLSQLPGPVYLYAPQFFYSYYKEQSKKFLSDSCFKKVEGQPLWEVVCGEIKN